MLQYTKHFNFVTYVLVTYMSRIITHIVVVIVVIVVTIPFNKFFLTIIKLLMILFLRCDSLFSTCFHLLFVICVFALCSCVVSVTGLMAVVSAQ